MATHCYNLCLETFGYAIRAPVLFGMPSICWPLSNYALRYFLPATGDQLPLKAHGTDPENGASWKWQVLVIVVRVQG
jgi:hypothetical protein